VSKLEAEAEDFNVAEGQEGPTGNKRGRSGVVKRRRGINKARDRKDNRRSPRAWHVVRDRCETWEAHAGPGKVREGDELELSGCRGGSQTDQ